MYIVFCVICGSLDVRALGDRGIERKDLLLNSTQLYRKNGISPFIILVLWGLDSGQFVRR